METSGCLTTSEWSKSIIDISFKWESNFLDLSFEENLVSIYDNVRYLSGISSLNADKAEIDILNKKTKIFMDNPSEKVLINKFSENGNNYKISNKKL